MEHQEYGRRFVQPDRFLYLFQHKQAVGLAVLPGQALGSASNADAVRMEQANALDQLIQCEFKAIVKTPDNGRVTFVSFARQILMKYFTNGAPRTAGLL
jgi:hypothetical protein